MTLVELKILIQEYFFYHQGSHPEKDPNYVQHCWKYTRE